MKKILKRKIRRRPLNKSVTHNARFKDAKNQQFSHKKSNQKKNYNQQNKNQAYKSNKKNNLPKLKKDTLRVVPLGGCEEVGRNMTVFEYNNDIVIIDMGFQFPEENTPGIDYIIPNIDYLKGKENKIRAVLFTHGHMDHIGAVPYLVNKLGNPLIIGNKLTLALIKDRMEDKEKGSSKKLKTLLVSDFEKKLTLGKFKVEFFPVSHSIIDALGIILKTPVINIIHPGDWNLPHGKVVGQQVNYASLNKKVKKPTALMLESLSVNYKNRPVPEEEMYSNLEKVIAQAPGRIIIATFSSMVERVKVILNMAEKYNRKVAIDGYSLRKNIKISKQIGYIKFNEKNLIDIKQIKNVPDEKLIVICTGAQGEEKAALNRIANGDHRLIRFRKKDTVIFSSSVIPGNERSVQDLKDSIYRQADHVVHTGVMDIHTGGHACADDVKAVIKMINPTYFIPVYANYYMLKEAANLAKKLGYADNKIFVPDNGSVIEFARNSAKILEQKANADPVFVDGLGVSDLQHVVFRDRQILSEDGMVVVVVTVDKRSGKLVQSPDIISRGFVYLKENKELISKMRKKIKIIVEPKNQPGKIDANFIKNNLRNKLGQFIYSKTEKRPMVLPVVIEF